MRLIDNWRSELGRLWSIRIGLFFGALNGAMLGLAAFVYVMPPVWFLILNTLGWAVLIGARLLKQPGAEC
jgi:hypothetical protein